MGNTLGQGVAGFGNGGGCVIECKEGGYMFGGTVTTVGTFGVDGNLTQPGYGNSDFWLVKLDINGNPKWDKVYGGSKGDHLTSLKQSVDGSYYLGGITYSDTSGTKKSRINGTSVPCSVAMDLWVVKVDQNGAYLWDRSLDDGDGGTDGMDGDALRFCAIDVTTDGGCIAGGTTDSCGTSFAKGDYFVTKLSSDGTINWMKTFGGIGQENLLSVQQTTDGGYLLGGTSEFSGISGSKTINNIGECFWVIKLDTTGREQWQKVVNADHDDVCYAYQVSDCYYMFAGSSSADVKGDKSQISQGGHDFWVVYLGDNSLVDDFIADTVCIDEQTHFKSGRSCATSWNWTFDDPASGVNNNSTLQNPEHTYSSEDKIYKVLLTSSNGSASRSISKFVVFDTCKAKLEVPNVITPNMDLKNDFFIVENSGFKELECAIYNRWGKKQYQFNALTGQWDGTTNGKACSNGVYYYAIEGITNTGEDFHKNGFVTLIQ